MSEKKTARPIMRKEWFWSCPVCWQEHTHGLHTYPHDSLLETTCKKCGAVVTVTNKEEE